MHFVVAVVALAASATTRYYLLFCRPFACHISRVFSWTKCWWFCSSSCSSLSLFTANLHYLYYNFFLLEVFVLCWCCVGKRRSFRKIYGTFRTTCTDTKQMLYLFTCSAVRTEKKSMLGLIIATIKLEFWEISAINTTQALTYSHTTVIDIGYSITNTMLGQRQCCNTIRVTDSSVTNRFHVRPILM